MLHEVERPSSLNGTASVTSGDVLPTAELPPGEWLSPPAAASQLGISERTLWRHVTAGRYHKRTVGGRAEVLVPGVAPVNPDTDSLAIAAPEPSAPVSSDTLTLAIVEELQRQHTATLALVERQADLVRCQAQEIGTATAERDAQQARADAALADRDRLAAELERERRRTWWGRLTGR